jgi:hypothetical protein
LIHSSWMGGLWRNCADIWHLRFQQLPRWRHCPDSDIPILRAPQYGSNKRTKRCVATVLCSRDSICEGQSPRRCRLCFEQVCVDTMFEQVWYHLKVEHTSRSRHCNRVCMLHIYVQYEVTAASIERQQCNMWDLSNRFNLYKSFINS